MCAAQADFGASKRIENTLGEGASVLSGLKGTPRWMAPEVIKGAISGSLDGWILSDVWSRATTTGGCFDVTSQLGSRLSQITEVSRTTHPPFERPRRETSTPESVGTPPRERLEIHFRSSQMNTLLRVEGQL